MKLENRTVQILKNFATINPSMLFREGNTQVTIAPQRNILARTTVAENFPKEFAIFDLSRFIGVLSLFNEPEIEYDDSRLLISQGQQKVAYTFADPSFIVAPPSKTPNVQDPEILFRLTSEHLQSTMRALGALQATHIIVEGDGENISIGVGKPSDPTGDTFKIEVGLSNHSFKFAFKAENIKILTGDYDVQISSRNISHFKGGDVEYWIMADANHSHFDTN
jgi:gp45 sliding clamp, C terminal